MTIIATILVACVIALTISIFYLYKRYARLERTTVQLLFNLELMNGKPLKPTAQALNELIMKKATKDTQDLFNNAEEFAKKLAHIQQN